MSYSPAIADGPITDLSETFQLEIDDNEGEGETAFDRPEDPEERNLLERRTSERELLKKCLQSCQPLRKDLLSFHSKKKEIHQKLLRTDIRLRERQLEQCKHQLHIGFDPCRTEFAVVTQTNMTT